ncbi:hypothetical protein [Arthrobacter sp. GMC3]|uniref:hypothetical protein n=1 Tax=Arthrobacter sp. GMC3 TaxID=2058894 RepID=UPI000CE2F62A|nr:hypothetical protein [Arthrobacter sp. GMC3]
MSAEALAVLHYDFGKLITAMVAARLTNLWTGVDQSNISGSWAERLPSAVSAVSAGQSVLAADAGGYVNAALLAQGMDPQGPMLVPGAFAGVASDGRALLSLLSFPAFTALQGIRGGSSLSRSMGAGLNQLMRIGQTQVADSHRISSGVGIASRRNKTGYVRMVEPGACRRCVVLAGKYYRWNDGFKRHPGCNCRHIPSTENLAGDMLTDPYEFFNSLSEGEQNRRFGADGAQAIRDGGDIYQVVNADRGMNVAGMKTTEGTTKAGNFGKPIRLTPEAIYKLNGADRAAAIRDLQKYGYILPAGQVPGGSILGQNQGGANFKRTAAEQRLLDSDMRWRMLQQGQNPFTGPLTPQISALVEKDYRRWLATNGHIFASN